MRAVDFACRLLVNIGRMELTHTEMKVLLALAAGMHESETIAEALDIRYCSCTLCLRNMCKRSFALRGRGSTYVLTAAGKSKVAQILSMDKTA